MYDKLLKPLQSFWITLYLSDQMGWEGRFTPQAPCYVQGWVRFGAGLYAVHKRKNRTSVENRTLLISRQLSRLLFGHAIYAENSRGYFSSTLLMSWPPLCRLHLTVNMNKFSRLVEFFNLHHGIGSNSVCSDSFNFLRPCYLALINSFEIHGL